MRYKIKVSRNDNLKAVEAQEQSRFIKSILEALEVPVEWNPDEPLSIDTKLKLRKEFDNYKINIIDDGDGGLKFFVETEIIAEWKKSVCRLIEDASKSKMSERLYYELEINFWTIFESDK